MNKSHRALLIGAAVWFVVVYWLAERGTFINGPDQRPIAVGVAFAAPILLFLLTIRMLPGWRALVTSISPVLLIALNGWRFIGLGFLMAHSEGLLPGGSPGPPALVISSWPQRLHGSRQRWRGTTSFVSVHCFWFGT